MSTPGLVGGLRGPGSSAQGRAAGGVPMPDLQPGLEQGDTWWVWEYTSAHKGSIASVSVAEEPQEMSGAGSNSSLL